MSINLQITSPRVGARPSRAGRVLAVLRVLAVVAVLAVTLSTHGGSVAAAAAHRVAGPAPGVAAVTGAGTGGGGTGSARQAVQGTEQGAVAPPRVQARAVILADESTGQVLFERNASSARAIASTTKVMLAVPCRFLDVLLRLRNSGSCVATPTGQVFRWQTRLPARPRRKPAATSYLIPSSAHGTNPASAVMAGMKVVVVASDRNGYVVVEDLGRRPQ